MINVYNKIQHIKYMYNYVLVHEIHYCSEFTNQTICK